MLFVVASLAAPFEDATEAAFGVTGGWTNKAALDDLDGDGDLDVIFADGGDYASAGAPAPIRLFRNTGGGFEAWVMPGDPALTRSIAAGDLDGDGWPELLVSGAHGTVSRLFVGGPGGFAEDPSRIPGSTHAFGDVALGDVDLDGDLDAVLADWGPGDPLSNPGGRTRLWRNDGGVLVDATDGAMPDVRVGMSWDLELADVDGDFDLDVLVSSKTSPGSSLFLNDGAGAFTDASERLPAFTNNYELAPMDVDGDGDLDLVTVNDGNGLREHLLINDGQGRFSNGNGTALPAEANLGEDDNVVEFLDLDDDGDPDFVIGSLSGPDRALINEGGGFALRDGPTFAGGGPTPGTLGLAFGDLDGDGRADAVMAQGEAADPERYFRGVDVAVDTRPPVIVGVLARDGAVLARVHDRMTPVRPSDLRVELRADAARTLAWAGGDLWRAEGPLEGELCAVDRAGNEVCASVGEDLGPPGPQPACGCASTGRLPLALAGFAALGVRRGPDRSRRGGKLRGFGVLLAMVGLGCGLGSSTPPPAARESSPANLSPPANPSPASLPDDVVCADGGLLLSEHAFEELVAGGYCRRCAAYDELACELDWPSSDVPGCALFDLYRNTILARHGMVFRKPEYASHFAKKAWYRPDPAYAGEGLSAVERDNIALLKRKAEAHEGCLPASP